MPAIRRIESAEEPVLDGLSTLLMDAVHDGASVGFLAPLSRDTARRYWDKVFTSFSDGMVVWIAEEGGEIVGTVQLSLWARKNGRQRGTCRSSMVLRALAASE